MITVSIGHQKLKTEKQVVVYTGILGTVLEMQKHTYIIRYGSVQLVDFLKYVSNFRLISLIGSVYLVSV